MIADRRVNTALFWYARSLRACLAVYVCTELTGSLLLTESTKTQN